MGLEVTRQEAPEPEEGRRRPGILPRERGTFDQRLVCLRRPTAADLPQHQPDGAFTVVGVENQAEPIPGYRLLERLGLGGFGEVWKAKAPGGLFKAVKIVYGCLGGADGDHNRAVRQELKSLERVKAVRHPFILSLERYDIVNGRLIIVTELADRSLWDRFRECQRQGWPGIPRDELLRYLEETAEALDLSLIHI